jgi:hypothetical protein
MVQKTRRMLNLLLCMTACCGSLCAQTEKTITLRMLDGRTHKLVAASGFLVRVDHEKTVHANWVVQNEDGTGKLTIPNDASVLSVQGTYDHSMQTYINCDSAADKANPIDRWYAVSEIMATGVAAPNDCEKPKEAFKFKVAVKPGEFVFFVRKLSWQEQMREDYSSH